MVAGELIGGLMALSFAGMADPASGHGAPVLGTWWSTIALFLFVAADGHLMLIAAVADSYAAWPPGGFTATLATSAARSIGDFGAASFAAGVAVAMPVLTVLLAGQIALALLGRAAPQLDLFAVGFPAAVAGGLILLAIAMPLLGDGLLAAMDAGLAETRALGSGLTGSAP